MLIRNSITETIPPLPSSHMKERDTDHSYTPIYCMNSSRESIAMFNATRCMWNACRVDRKSAWAIRYCLNVIPTKEIQNHSYDKHLIQQPAST